MFTPFTTVRVPNVLTSPSVRMEAGVGAIESGSDTGEFGERRLGGVGEGDNDPFDYCRGAGEGVAVGTFSGAGAGGFMGAFLSKPRSSKPGPVSLIFSP